MKKFLALLCLSIGLAVRSWGSDCFETPPGCVARWHFDGDGFESITRTFGTVRVGSRIASGFLGGGLELRNPTIGFEIPEPSVFQSDSFTIEFWVQRFSRFYTSAPGSVTGGLMGGSQWGFGLFLTQSGRMEVGNSKAVQEYGGPSIRDLNWHHVAAVVDGKWVRLYVDGTLTRVASVERPFALSSIFAIGSATHTGTKYGFTGSMDEVTLYGRALTQQEVGRIFLEGARPRCEETPSVHWGATRYGVRLGDSVDLSLVLRDYRANPLGPSTIHGEVPESVDLESVSVNAGGACVSKAGTFDCEIDPMEALGSVPLAIRIRPRVVGPHSTRVHWALRGKPTFELISSAETSVFAWPNCSVLQDGMSAWWRGESSSMEWLTGSSGFERGSIQFTNGLVGHAFWLDGLSSVTSPGATVDPLANLTIEFWLRRGALDRVSNVPGKSAVLLSTAAGLQLMLRGSDGALMLGGDRMGWLTSDRAIRDLLWHHVAVVRRSGIFHLHVDGDTGGPWDLPDLVGANFSAPFRFGDAMGREEAGVGGFLGALDEIALYDRALSTKTMKEIVTLGSAAKCREDLSVELQPLEMTRSVGAESEWTLRVTNGGTNAARRVVAILPMEPEQELVRFTADQGSCDLKGGELWCELGDLQGETHVLIRPVFRYRSEGIHRISAQVRRDEADLFPGNNIDSVVCRVVGPCIPESSGLVGRWTGDGHARDVAVNTTATHDTGRYGAGVGGGGLAFELDGTGGIRAGEQGGLHPMEFTWSGWVRPARVSRGWSTLVFWEGAGHLTPRLHLALLANAVEPGGAARLALRMDLPAFPKTLEAGWHTWADGGGSLPLGEWSHVAVTCDAKGLTSVFVNGQRARQLQAGSRVATRAGELDFGRTPEEWLVEEEGAHFEGNLSELKLFGRALEAEEIRWQASKATVHSCLPKVSLRLVHPPEVVEVGGLARATLTLSNEVKTAIGRCQVRLESSAGLKWHTATLAGGDCQILGGEILCELPSLGAGVEAELAIACEVLDPTNGGELSARLSVVDGGKSEYPMELRFPIDVSRPCGLIPGRVAYWGLDGTLADDALGMALDGAEGFEFVEGRVGRALRFDGRGGLSVRSPQPMFLQELSIECWYRRQTLLATANSGEFGTLIASEKDGWNFSLTSEGALSFGRTGFERVDTWPAVRDLEWHHLAVTKRGGVVKFYVDGVAIGAYAFDVQFDFGSGIAVGGLAGRQLNRLIGTLDELVIYDRALEDSEVHRAFTHWMRSGCANDLELRAEVSRASVDSGHPFEVKWAVSNRGASRSGRFQVHAKLPPEFRLNGFSNPRGECRLTDGDLVCEVNELEAGSTTTIRCVVRSGGPSRWVQLESEIQGASLDLVTANSRTSNHLLIRQACVNLPPGLVAWWTGDFGNTVESEWLREFPGFDRGFARVADRRTGSGIVGAGFAFSAAQGDGRLETRLPGAVATQGVTISYWLKVASLDATPRILIRLFNPVNRQSTIELGIRPWSVDTRGVRFEPILAVPDTSGLSLPEAYWAASRIGLEMDAWHHLAVVCDAAQRFAVLYVNGVEARRIQLRPGSYTVADPMFSLEYGAAHLGSVLRATVDEAMIFARTLESGEIALMSNTGSAGACRSDVELTLDSAGILRGQPGIPFNVHLTAKNRGERPMTGLVLTNEVPGFLNILDLGTSVPGVRTEVVDHQLRTLVGTLAPGESFDLTVHVQGRSPTAGEWRSSIGGAESDLALSNNQVIRSVAVETVRLSLRNQAGRPRTSVSRGVFEAIVQASPAPGSTVEVDYWTDDGTAIAGVDYVALRGRLVIPAGTTNSVIPIPLINDGKEDVLKEFTITLGNPKNAELSTNRLAAILMSNGQRGAFTVDDPVAIEGNSAGGSLDFRIRLAAPSLRSRTVGYRTVSFTAQENLDFEPAEGVLTFESGDTEKVVSIRLIDDSLPEPLESFGLAIYAGGSGVRAWDDKLLGIGSIRDDDSNPSAGVRGFEWEILNASEVPAGSFQARVRAVDFAGKTAKGFSGSVQIGASSGSGIPSSLVLTEFFDTDKPTFEVQNVTAGSVDASGWRLLFYAGPEPVAPIGSQEIPENTRLESGVVFVVRTPGYVAPVTGIILQDPAGNVRDCLFLDGATPGRIEEPRPLREDDWVGGTPRRPYGGYSLSRIGDSREGFATAWTLMLSSVGVSNVGLSIPFIESRQRTVEPGVVAEFREGIYTGTFRVLGPDRTVRLIADDGEGHRGVSARQEIRGPTAGTDLQLGLYSESLHKTFEPFHFEAYITNQGPDVVGHSVVAVPFSVAWNARDFQELENSHGTAPVLVRTNGQSVVLATVNDLGPNQVARIHFALAIPGLPAAERVPIHGRVSVPDSDPDPRNNRATTFVEISRGAAGPFNTLYKPSSWWPATDGARDIVRGVTGVLSGGARIGEGRVGPGFHFEGGASALVLPNAAVFNLGSTQVVQIEFWLRTRPYDVRDRIHLLSKRDPSSGLGYSVVLDHGIPRMSLDTGIPGSIPIEEQEDFLRDPLLLPFLDVRDGRWHHVGLGVWRNGPQHTLYVDGLPYLFNGLDTPVDFSNSAEVVVGADLKHPEQSFDGDLDELIFLPTKDDTTASGAAAGGFGRVVAKLDPSVDLATATAPNRTSQQVSIDLPPGLVGQRYRIPVSIRNSAQFASGDAWVQLQLDPPAEWIRILPEGHGTGQVGTNGFAEVRLNSLARGEVVSWPLEFLSRNSTQRVSLIVAASAQNVLVDVPWRMTVKLMPDADGDGMEDAWELAHGLDPNNPNDGRLDPDGDGLTNAEEYTLGTSPTDAESAFQVGMRLGDFGGVEIQWQSVPGRRYELLRRGDSLDDPWTVVQIITATQPLTTAIDGSMPSAGGFYAVRLIP